jgi:6-phosphogluconate dehydrogenase
MQIGMVGLGRMGGNMTERLRGDGHEVCTYDPRAESTASSLEELVQQLAPPRALWLMVPVGETTEQTVRELLRLVDAGDTIVDGGNSYFRDTERRHAEAAEHGVHFVGVGTSGGVWGLEIGYCLMVGGPHEAVERLRPAFETLAPENGWAHVGPGGAGHFVKMVHNAIEYGLMQAYAEGFELMHHSDYDLDLREISGIWRYGSVVRSWLLELLHEAFEEHGSGLEEIGAFVEDSGMGRWSINEAISEAVPTPVLAASLFARFASRREINFSAKVAAALRNQFGGHAIRAVEHAKEGPDPR